MGVNDDLTGTVPPGYSGLIQSAVRLLELNGYKVKKPKPHNSKQNQAALHDFDKLPDAAFVRVQVVAALRGCHVNTVWRHVKSGLLPEPKKLGPQVTGWNVGELRRAMK